MDGQTTDIPSFADIFHYNVTIKALETYEAHVINCDVTIQKYVKLLDARSLTCKIRGLNGLVSGNLIKDNCERFP